MKIHWSVIRFLLTHFQVHLETICFYWPSSPQLLSVVPFDNIRPEPMLIKVANHTECRCQEPQLIRRHAHPQGSGSVPALLLKRLRPLRSQKPQISNAFFLLWRCLCLTSPCPSSSNWDIYVWAQRIYNPA